MGFLPALDCLDLVLPLRPENYRAIGGASVQSRLVIGPEFRDPLGSLGLGLQSLQAYEERRSRTICRDRPEIYRVG